MHKKLVKSLNRAFLVNRCFGFIKYERSHLLVLLRTNNYSNRQNQTGEVRRRTASFIYIDKVGSMSIDSLVH